MKLTIRFQISILLLFGFLGGAGVALCADYHSPRAIALGGAGHAGPLLNDAVFLNQSFSSFLPTYSIGMNYLAFSGPPSAGDPAMRGRNYSLSIQDGRTEMFQAGAAYSLRTDGALIHVGISKTIFKYLGVGVGGKFFYNDPSNTGGRDAVFSMTGVVSSWLQAALIVDNLIQSEEGKNHGFYREAVLGLKFNVDGIVLVYVDPHYVADLPEDQRFGQEAGVEFVVMNDFFLRVGQFKNSAIPAQSGARGRGWGAGFGWIAPRLSLDYGLSRVLEPRPSTSHTFGATMYF